MKKSKKRISNSKRLEILYRIKVLENQYKEECREIADQCEAEGYPAHGSNYGLRCEAARELYDEQIDALYDMLGN